jgi:DNA-binding MurR/RpiR family transcriptional regulator
MKNGLEIIKQVIDELPKAEKKAATYIIENPEDLKILNISQLAEASKSSTAAIVRLCKRLNFDGFQQLKISVVINTISQPEKNTFEDFKIEKGVLVKEIIASSIGKVNNAINLIPMVISEDSIKEAAMLINEAKQIQILGIGASGIVALDLMQKLQRIGIPAFYYPDVDMQLTTTCNLGDNDICIGISYSGKNPSVIKAIKQAKKQKAKCITLSRFGSNKLSELGDVKLFVPAVEPLIREAATISRISQLFIVDILFSYLISLNPEKIKQSLTQTWNIIHSENFSG